jgi:hypothetical protein
MLPASASAARPSKETAFMTASTPSLPPGILLAPAAFEAAR